MPLSFNAQRPAGASRNASPVREAAAAAAAQPEAQAHQEPAPNLNPGVHRQTATQAALLAQLQPQAGGAPAQPSSASTARANSGPSLQAHWNAWARAGGATGGNRTEAVRRMTAWLAGNDATAPLTLSGLELTSLPDALPDSLQRLDVSFNQLTRLPDALPDSLKELDVGFNQLTHLPDALPHALQTLSANENRLTRLPDALPGSIQKLDVSCNQLTSLPDALPNALQKLDVSLNQLTHLPANFATQLGRGCTVRLEGNRLPPLVIVWYDWAQSGGATGGNRAEAFRRMMVWLDGNDASAPLELELLELTSLPDSLPDSLQVLTVSQNHLTRLPNELPAALRELNCSCNALEHLPDSLPSALRVLYANLNYLNSLPDALPNSLEMLNVSENLLTRLPDPLPNSLKELDVGENQLIQWPRSLPNGLEHFCASNVGLTHLPFTLPNTLRALLVYGNRLTHLPDVLPECLQVLYVYGNRLTRLPDPLPHSLQELEAGENLLTHLTETLPNSLRVLEANDNQLTRLPENITTQLSSQCSVCLDGNPLSERVIRALSSITGAPGYEGPRIQFSMGGRRRAAVAVRPLAAAVATWFEGEHQNAVRQAWAAFQDEAGQDAFSGFLDYLGRSVNARSADFRRATAEWLTHLATHASLRDNTFQISQGATTSCEDRVSLALNDMKKARLVADIESGAYDQRLPDLITLARGMFRLDKLETIARHKASTLRFIDEIEVYLAYQVKLRERLNLPIDTADMRYFGVSNVTERDLDAAEASIRAAGPNEMIDYLSIDWSPWESVLSRSEPEGYQEAKARLHEVTDNEFEGRLAKRLKRSDEATLANDIDAQVQAGPSIMKEIRREIMVPLTTSFLETRNLMGLLE